MPEQEGTVWIEDGGTKLEGHWYLENGIVSVYVGDFGPFATHTSPAGPETVARWLMREFLRGRKKQEQALVQLNESPRGSRLP
jgi:hypothetical protein